MPVVQFEISDELMHRLKTIISNKDGINHLALAALEEWVAWLEGSLRPMSMSDLETQRIFAIYDRVLTNELPSADHLGKLLKLPMGRSRYIIQSLAYRYGHLLPQRQMRAIACALRDGRWSADRKTCVVTIDRACQSIMNRSMSGLKADGRLKSTVRGIITMDGVRYDLGSNHHTELTAVFDPYLNDEQGGE